MMLVLTLVDVHAFNGWVFFITYRIPPIYWTKRLIGSVDDRLGQWLNTICRVFDDAWNGLGLAVITILILIVFFWSYSSSITASRYISTNYDPNESNRIVLNSYEMTFFPQPMFAMECTSDPVDYLRRPRIRSMSDNLNVVAEGDGSDESVEETLDVNLIGEGLHARNMLPFTQQQGLPEATIVPQLISTENSVSVVTKSSMRTMSLDW